MVERARLRARHKIALVLFGVLLAAVVLEVGLRAAGWVYSSVADRPRAVAEEGELRILCIGESTTAPWLHRGKDISWPVQLEVILNERQSGLRYRVINRGVIGTNSAAQLATLEQNLRRYRPHLVVSMLGINDGGDTILYEGGFSDRVALFFRGMRLYKLYKVWANRYEFHRKEGGANPLEQPQSAADHLALGLLHVENVQLDAARKVFLAMQQRFPEDPGGWFGTGRVFLEQGRLAEAERELLRALELRPEHIRAHQYLGWVYHEQGRAEEAKRQHELAVELNPEEFEAYQGFALFYRNIGDMEGFAEWSERSREFEVASYDPILQENYRRIVDTIVGRGIDFIAMQYPLRNVQALERLLQQRDDIRYLDNRSNFREALAGATYEDLFVDFFGGDFGHCTERGNRLIAENVARAIPGSEDQ